MKKDMKNIFFLPTDQPSSLGYHFDKVSSLNSVDYAPNFGFDEFNTKNNYQHRPYHLYITSDEEIKKDDNFLDLTDNTLWVNKGPSSMSKTLFPECKKIILTTDQDLIKDGVQAIDDEFLEWFVKNPSCEFAEIKDLLSNNGNAFYGYKIIIPFEVVCVIGDCDYLTKNVEYYVTGFDIDKYYLISDDGDIVSCYKEWFEVVKVKQEEPKQETLEEAAGRLYPTTIDSFTDTGLDLSERERLIFKNGAKWQAERMYSEEESIQKIIDYVDFQFNTGGELNSEIKKWFEQFKKK